ncbi:MAG TPA: PQQ-binding-like beta-propeller repeat protein [Phycisphaerae bacterium]|nr:PQQ-binding-like beta-propeller repeat protein [Phycisphaerae bacterium]
MHFDPVRLALVVCLGLAAWPTHSQFVLAQDEDAGPGPPEDRPPAADPSDVYLDDSFEADEWIAKAARQAAEGDWKEATRNVSRALEEHADKLSRTAPGRFVSLPERANRLIASWPAEGLRAYRRIAEPGAGQQLAAARTDRRIETLLAVADSYFCTVAGAEALKLVGQAALEAGDFPVAVRAYRRLLDDHPDRARLRGEVTAQLAIAYALGGQAEKARELAAETAAGGDAGSVVWMGESRPVAELIESLLVEVEPVEQPGAGPAWPTFGGHPGRNRAGEFAVAQLAVLWRVDSIGDASGVAETDMSSSFRRALSKGRYLTMNPVVADNTVYVQDSRRVWALHLSSGRVIWRYAGPGDPGEIGLSVDSEVPRWYAPTVAGARVYACLGSEVVSYYGYEPAANTSALVCLDAGTGAELWRADRAALGESFEEMDFESTPIAAGQRVYVVARRTRSFGFEDCFLYGFDANSGRLEFRTHLGSASTGGFGYRRSTLAVPSLVDDTVYLCTNLGTIAAVDRHSGRVRWLRLYPRIGEAQWRREGRASSHETSPWQLNPLICVDDRLVALPTDAATLLVLDRASGDIERSIPLDKLHNAQTILGVDGSIVYGVGDQVFSYDLEAGRFVWESRLPDDADLLGRGIWTAEQVLIPTRTALCAYSRSDGQLTQQPWEATEGGNILAVPGQLIVAGNDCVTAFAHKEDVLNRLRLAMDRAPQDPVPALDLAELLFRTGDTDEALAILDEAIARAGGFARPIEPDLKRRIFDDCLASAAALARAEQPDLERIISLFERASQCPPDTQAHLTYRLEWAAVYERAGRFADATGLYQQIIADRTLREARRDTAEGRSLRAGDLAESAIRRLIGEHGPDVYQRFERQAAEWLSAGRTAGDLELLARVVQVYPNSQAAPAAAAGGGHLLRQQGKPLEAARAFAEGLSRYPQQPDAPAVMRSIADCYVDAGRPEHAWRWLTKAARQYPQATVDVGGRKVRFSEYRDRVADARARVTPSRPHLEPPLGDTPGTIREFDEPFWLLDPLFGDTPGASWGFYLIYAGGNLQAHDARTGRELWDDPSPCPQRPDLLLATPSTIVLVTQDQILGLEATSGQRLWEFGEAHPERDDPLADPEDLPAFATFALAGNSLVAGRTDAEAVRLDIKTGREIWRTKLEHAPTGPMTCGDPGIVYQAAHYGEPIFCLLETDTGKLLRVLDPEDDRRAEHVLFTLEGRLILVTSETVHCHDPVTGRALWSVRREQGILSGTVQLDLDGLYLSDDGRHLEKLSLADGRTLWRSETPADRLWRGADAITVTLFDEQVLVATERRVFALSGSDGRVLWEGTTRRGLRFDHRFVGESFLVAVDAGPENFQDLRTVYFYDLRNASGLIPSNGGVQALGVFEDLKRITIRDGALLLQDGRTLSVWTSPAGE